ncbi:flagellin [Clostridium sp. OS1-26]|uniref:flagellin N-terminal helical domain-containing protein n=1 Tax=Clostridium sp. OS1-26 TaxID=3070681 RepID=UPI0027E0810C|nr:flagellin [Clostridium sp. OS1-26]WML35448.1 flagellin [Clostridium sp. OS1-26]
MRLSHNMASLNIYMTHKRTLESQSSAMNKISTGYKVNNAKDDPNVIAQSERTRMQIRGLQMAGKNSQDGISMLQSAEGGLDSATQMLQRIRELVVQSGSGSSTDGDRKVIQNEINQMVEGIGSIVDCTEFNGKSLLNKTKLNEGTVSGDGEFVELDMPVGANAGESVKIPIYDLSPGELKVKDGVLAGKSLKDVNIESGGKSIDDALSILNNALDKTISVRSKYGALENRFEDTMDNVSEISDRMEGADSNLRDADIAEEMIKFTKDNILLEAGSAMMAQSNKFPQDVLRILENLKSR